MPYAVAVIMTQLSFKSGTKHWKGKGQATAKSERKHMHLRYTFKSKHSIDLNENKKKSILEYHIFIKEKRDGKIKGRTVSGGKKQRGFITKEDSSSPTVSTEAVLFSCIIDEEEKLDVSEIDTPHMFIHTRVENVNEMSVIKSRGVLVELILEIDTELYGTFVTTDKKGENVIIVKYINAIYGTMVASLLYYNKSAKTLKRNGFQLNPYDPCVANHMVNGKQQIICFHLDNCKLSQQYSKLNDEFINTLCDEYESVYEYGYGKMKAIQGKVHEYLGMTLDYIIKGQVKITILDIINKIMECLDKAEPKSSSTKSSAAPLNMFVVYEDCEKLSKGKSETLHNLIENMLFATKRACTDTGKAISYLKTRVRDPDKIDRLKMVHLFKYVRGTKDLPLIISAYKSGILKWYIDGSYEVHPNMRGNTGTVMKTE